MPAADPLFVRNDSPWLPPISFGAQAYLELCQEFDLALRELEARYPSPRPLLSLSSRNKRLKKKKRRPK
jgi:hypothetical protein